MLREVPMRMFSSLKERINDVREQSKLQMFPVIWSLSDGLQHGFTITNVHYNFQ